MAPLLCASVMGRPSVRLLEDNCDVLWFRASKLLGTGEGRMPTRILGLYMLLPHESVPEFLERRL